MSSVWNQLRHTVLGSTLYKSSDFFNQNHPGGGELEGYGVRILREAPLVWAGVLFLDVMLDQPDWEPTTVSRWFWRTYS